jgi:hypothetical protein
VIAVMRKRLAAGEAVARMYQEPGLAVELLNETPSVPVVVRYDPANGGPAVAHWPLL